MRVNEALGLQRRISGVGYHEVIVESPDHAATLSALEGERSGP